MKLSKIIIISILLISFKSFALSPISNTDKTDLINKMKDDKDVFSLLFKGKIYGIMVSAISYEEVSQETRENITKMGKDLHKHKVNVDSKFPEYAELNNATKREIMEKLINKNASKLKSAANCFSIGVTAELAACGAPRLFGWVLTKWNWCMGTVVTLDLVTAATSPEAFDIIIESGGIERIARTEMSFCGRIATRGANVPWEDVVLCTVSFMAATTVVCIHDALGFND